MSNGQFWLTIGAFWLGMIFGALIAYRACIKVLKQKGIL